jgi:hypothetical protein
VARGRQPSFPPAAAVRQTLRFFPEENVRGDPADWHKDGNEKGERSHHMTERRMKGRMRLAALVLAAAILGAAGAPAFAEDDGAKAEICWTALENCILWGVKTGVFATGVGAAVIVSYCADGYAFCEKFVAPFLRGRAA